MSVSLCLIVKNEAGHLKKCLTSFKDLCDEIIVADTGSTDNTKEIARKCGAKVFDYKWRDDFSSARNFAIRKAENQWIMMVDADDVIEKKALLCIKKTLKKIPAGIKVISLPYVYCQTDRQPGNTAWLPKIWRRSLGLKYVYPIHEYLDIGNIPASSILKLEAPIIHLKTGEDFAKGFKRNIRIMKPFIKKHPRDLRILYYLIHDHRHLGEFKKTIHWCEKYFETKPKDPVKLNKVFMLQGICHLRLGNDFEAQASFLLAIGAQPKLIEPYLELSDMYYRMKRYSEAIHMARCARLCEMPENSRHYFNRAVYDYFADRKLAYLLAFTGRPKEALKYAEKVLKFTPRDPKLARHIKTLKKQCFE